MPEKLKQIVGVPVWLIGIFVTVLLVLFSVAVMAGEQKQKVATLEEQIKTKADKSDIQYIKETLNEIKTDLKTHMDK